MANIAEDVKAIIVEKLGVDASEVTETASFTNDLGADSLDIVELIMDFEKKFDIEIPDDDAGDKIATVGDAIKYIEEKAPDKQGYHGDAHKRQRIGDGPEAFFGSVHWGDCLLSVLQSGAQKQGHQKLTQMALLQAVQAQKAYIFCRGKADDGPAQHQHHGGTGNGAQNAAGQTVEAADHGNIQLQQAAHQMQGDLGQEKDDEKGQDRGQRNGERLTEGGQKLLVQLSGLFGELLALECQIGQDGTFLQAGDPGQVGLFGKRFHHRAQHRLDKDGHAVLKMVAQNEAQNGSGQAGDRP